MREILAIGVVMAILALAGGPAPERPDAQNNSFLETPEAITRF